VKDETLDRIVALLSVAAAPFEEPRDFSLTREAAWRSHLDRIQAALDAVHKLSHPVLWDYFADLSSQARVASSHDSLLVYANEQARAVLRKLRAEQRKWAEETTQETWQRVTAGSDPWLVDVNLEPATIARVAAAPDPEVVSDERGNARFL
jgi:hypothetical protein